MKGLMLMSVDDLPLKTQKALAIIKEAGAIGLAVIIVGFYLGQQAGLIGNIDRVDHAQLITETQRQTVLLIQNQRSMQEVLDQMKGNNIAFLQLARGICISVTKTSEIEKRCLGVER